MAPRVIAAVAILAQGAGLWALLQAHSVPVQVGGSAEGVDPKPTRAPRQRPPIARVRVPWRGSPNGPTAPATRDT